MEGEKDKTSKRLKAGNSCGSGMINSASTQEIIHKKILGWKMQSRLMELLQTLNIRCYRWDLEARPTGSHEIALVRGVGIPSVVCVLAHLVLAKSLDFCFLVGTLCYKRLEGINRKLGFAYFFSCRMRGKVRRLGVSSEEFGETKGCRILEKPY